MEQNLYGIDPQIPISQFVRQNYRTADVFRKYGISYCCGGNVSLEEACRQKGLDQEVLIGKLQEVMKPGLVSNNLQYDDWKTDFLIDYIVHVHHAYLKQALPPLETSLESFVQSHKSKSPKLEDILRTFRKLSSLLQTHNRYEEDVVFPYIKQMDNALRRKETYGHLFVRTLRKPLNAILQNEHQNIRLLVNTLRELTDNYQFPENACIAHQVVFHKLHELDNDLMQHKHLENIILFPRALAMEGELLQAGI